jgi:DNA (cytosine-5)-methyltransferase 1
MVLKLLDLFSGIGGFSYAAERIVGGYETTQFVEIDSYCQSVLRKNFPNTPIHDDIKTFSAKPGQFDVFTVGFPCQDLSVAGRQRGINDETRSGLFYESIRLLRQVRPRFALFENVRNLLSHEKGETFQEVLFQIAKAGYDAEWSIISAKDLGACHLRERIWIVAYSKSQSSNGTKFKPFFNKESSTSESRNSNITITNSNQSNSREGRIFENISDEGWSTSKNRGKSIQSKDRETCTDNTRQSDRIITNTNNNGSSSSKRNRINEETSSNSQKGENKISKSERSSKSTGSRTVQSFSETPDFTNSDGSGTQSNSKSLEKPIWKHAFLNSKERRTLSPDWTGYVSEPSLCRGDDGLRGRVARLKALGNSIVPQCAAVPLQRIKDLNEELW